jgi:hypothetical protein
MRRWPHTNQIESCACNDWRDIANSHSKMLTLVHSFFSSCGGLRFLRMDSPRISMRWAL